MQSSLCISKTSLPSQQACMREGCVHLGCHAFHDGPQPLVRGVYDASREYNFDSTSQVAPAASVNNIMKKAGQWSVHLGCHAFHDGPQPLVRGEKVGQDAGHPSRQQGCSHTNENAHTQKQLDILLVFSFFGDAREKGKGSLLHWCVGKSTQIPYLPQYLCTQPGFVSDAVHSWPPTSTSRHLIQCASDKAVQCCPQPVPVLTTPCKVWSANKQRSRYAEGFTWCPATSKGFKAVALPCKIHTIAVLAFHHVQHATRTGMTLGTQ